MNFNLKKNLPMIIIATIVVALFGTWYLTYNVNKKIIIQGAADALPKKISFETPKPEITVSEIPAFSEIFPEPSAPERSQIPEPSELPEVLKDGKININTAGIELLKSLPGIGEKIAQSIIEYRNENGSFKSIEEIKNVPRIGEATFQKLKNLIYCGDN